MCVCRAPEERSGIRSRHEKAVVREVAGAYSRSFLDLTTRWPSSSESESNWFLNPPLKCVDRRGKAHMSYSRESKWRKTVSNHATKRQLDQAGSPSW